MEPPRSAADPAPRGLAGRLFGPVRIPPTAPGELRALAARGSLVVVMRHSGLLNYLYVRWLVHRLGLPPLRAAQGFRGLFGALTRVRRSRRALEVAVGAGHTSLLFLNEPGDPSDAFQTLVRLQPSLSRPIVLVPALLLYSRRAQRLQPTAWDLVLGSADSPNALANAVGFLRSVRRAFLSLGHPLDLQAFLAAHPAAVDAEAAQAARGALHQRLARQLRNAVGPPLKTPERVRQKVLRDRTLRSTLEGVAHETGRPLATVEVEAGKCFREIASRYDPRLISVAAVVLSGLFRKLYEAVEVDEAGLAAVQRAAADGPLVFCPSHKSYVDFLVLSWVLYRRGMTPPHVAAGINLSFWPFGAIARMGGAFFIRRTVKGDRVYTAVLRAYVKQLLRDRFPQEFYVEGGRSRTGKLLYPKMGLVSMEVDAWLDGATADVLFVPVAIDYERLIEASAYARELGGGEKKKENLGNLLGAAGVLLRSYERLYVQFERPISLRAVAAARRPVPGDPAEQKRLLVKAMATRVAYGIGLAVTITPVGLVAAALLSTPGRTRLEAAALARRLELLRTIAAEGGARFGRDLAGASSDPRQPGPVADAVARLVAARVVEVGLESGAHVYQAVDEKRPLLDYHKNVALHRFVGPAIVSTALLAGGPGPQRRHEVLQRAIWLSRLLKLEFMYPPGSPVGGLFQANLEILLRARAASAEPAPGGLASAPPAAQSLTAGPDLEATAFLAALLHPFLEAYRLTAATAVELLAAPPRGGLDGKGLVKAALERGRTELTAGRLRHREALSKATVENAVEWLVATGALAEAGGKLAAGPDPAALARVIDGMTPFLAA
jgi:glycerol-3-phosphate O-acyltransferase